MAEKILVVDDHDETRNLVTLILKQQGYRLFDARTGSEGLVAAERERPDLILLDVMMPDMDGLEVCRRVRAHDALKEVPIIMFTAKSEAAEKWEGFEAGATDYLVKPTNKEELSKRVRTILDRNSKAPSSMVADKEASGRGSIKTVQLPRNKIAQTTAFPKDMGAPRPQIISFIGARGGVGTTTAAINTAFTLAKRLNTILVDFDMQAGHVGLYLKRQSSGGLNELAAGSAFSIRGQIPNEAIELTPRLQLLLSQPNMTDVHPVFEPNKVPHLVEALAGYDRQVVVDAGRGVTPTNQPMLERADHVVVCLRPEKIAIAGAKPLIAHLKEIVLPTTVVHLAMLDFGQTISLPQKAIEQFIGHKIHDVIKITRKQMIQATNNGLPLIVANADSSLPESFARLSKHFLIAS